MAELLSEKGVISTQKVDSVKTAANSSEAVLKATKRGLASNYKRIEIFGDVLCTVPGNEEIGKAICRSYGELTVFMVLIYSLPDRLLFYFNEDLRCCKRRCC